MPRRKIPPDAFTYYFSLGPDRSYERVATRYGVTKRAVTRFAHRDRWQERLLEAERKAREDADQKAAKAIEAMNERHLKAARFLQTKALTELQQKPLSEAISAVKAFEVGIRTERLVLGEPSERTEMDVAQIIKREYERWMAPAGAEERDSGGDDEGANEAE